MTNGTNCSEQADELGTKTGPCISIAEQGQKLKSIDDIINLLYSKSTLANMERYEQLLLQFAKTHDAGDPYTVSIESTELVMNLLVENCRYNTDEALTVDTMGG